jgi:hypothetical protein
VSDEARFLLGKIAVAASEPDRAESIWSPIAVDSPRWLDSRLAKIALDLDRIELAQINVDRHSFAETFQRADRFAADCIASARSEADRTELMLARARLNLTPGAGRPELARELAERVSHLPGSPGQLYQARLYRLVALVELGRYIDAEREAASHSSWRVATEKSALFEAIRLLDQCSSGSDTDLNQQRSGLVLRLIVEPLPNADAEIPPIERAELAVRRTRALLFTGADRDAHQSLITWGDIPREASDRLLRDVGDTCNRLAVYTLGVDIERLRSKNNPPGSLRWLDARYALALAYFRSGKVKEAARIIDATAILHPELGGGSLHDKFIHLRQRLGVKP